MNDRIEALLRYKSSDQLDDAEQAEVLAEMSLSEYDLLHRARIALHKLDADAAPAPALRERLLAHGRAKGYFQNPSARWWQHRIPIWQAAAACLLALAAGYFFYEGRVLPGQEKITEKIVFQRDTIVRTDTLWRRQIIVRYRAPDPSGGFARLADSLRVDTPPQAMNTSTGTPIGDMPALMEFLGGVDN